MLPLEEMKLSTKKIVDDFIAQDPKSFYRPFIKTHTMCDVIMNKMAEIFNAYIMQARGKHFIFILDDIRIALVQRIIVKRGLMDNAGNDVCPRTRAKIEKERGV